MNTETIPPAPTVCLAMIVRDEAHVLPRSLASIRPFVHHWIVVDTGSTDGTQEVARRELTGLPGECIARPWRDFGTNRTEALRLARGRGDYVFMLDADELFEPAADFAWPADGSDCWDIWLTDDETGLYWTQPRLTRNDDRWGYAGVLHEYLTAAAPFTRARVPGAVIRQKHDGARSLAPDRLELDAETLNRALEADPDNARYAFYLAQTLNRAARPQAAIRAYRRRVRMGGWEEEVWYSLLQIAELKLRLGTRLSRVRDAFLEAWNYRPRRAESLVRLAAVCRQAGRPAEAFAYAWASLHVPEPDDVLFVDTRMYRWIRLDECAVACGHLQRHQDAITLNNRLLREGALPESERSRVIANRALSLRALGLPDPLEDGTETTSP